MSFAVPTSSEALFAVQRRDDVSVTANQGIVDVLGENAGSFAETLTKAGAAAIYAYPELLVQFDLSRIFGNAANLSNHTIKADKPLGPLVEQAIRAIGDEAGKHLRAIDPDAFIQINITSRKPTVRERTGRERSQYRYWRGF